MAVLIDSAGQLGTASSSERFKKDIKDMSSASRRLLDLRPVTYHYKQESVDGKIETVQYHKLTPMLVNELQLLNKLLQTEKNKVETQAEEIASLKQEMKHLNEQTQKIAMQEKEISKLKGIMTLVQSQAQQIDALASRLSRIQAKETLGMK